MGSDQGTGGTDTGTDTGANDPQQTLGGCNTSGGSTGGLVTFLLVGLAAFIRRRK
jgi:uncharacterized protein (TIGR03382 family)